MEDAVPSLLLVGIKQEESTAEEARVLTIYKCHCHGFLPEKPPGSSENDSASSGDECQPSTSPESSGLSSAVGIRNPSLPTFSSLPTDEFNTETKVYSFTGIFNEGAHIQTDSTELLYPKLETKNSSLEENTDVTRDILRPDCLDSTQVPKKYSCEICGKTFVQSCRMRQHVDSVHKGLREHGCGSCDKAFTTKSDLKHHVIRVHQKLREHSCGSCDRAFVTKRELKLHVLRVHQTDLREHSCESCGKAFRMKLDLQSHVHGVHQNLREHSCGLCDRAFVRIQQLKRHVLSVHQNVREHSCGFCHKAFGTKAELKQHVLRVHENLREHICAYCDKAFVTKQELRRHVRSNHRLEEISAGNFW